MQLYPHLVICLDPPYSCENKFYPVTICQCQFLSKECFDVVKRHNTKICDIIFLCKCVFFTIQMAISLKKHKLQILNNEKVAVLAFSSLQTEQEV